MFLVDVVPTEQKQSILTDLFLGSQYTDPFLGSQYTDLFLEGGESATGWATAAASVEAPPVSSSEK